MNKKEFIKVVAKKKKKTQKEVEEVLDVVIETIKETLISGESVNFIGFGKFEVSERSAREGRNPATGESMMIEACKAPKFKAGKALKDAVNAK